MPTLNIDPLLQHGASAAPGTTAPSSDTGSVIGGAGLGDIQSYLGSPEFEALMSSLEGPAKADLEAYIRQLFGESGGTIGQEVAAGRMTMDEARQMLIESGLTPAVADNMIASGKLNVPLLTIPGDIETRMGPRGGSRALAGPYAIQRSLASQEVARRASVIRPDILQRILPALLQHDTASRQMEMGGPGEAPGGEPPKLPPLPPIPLPPAPQKPEGTPWWAAMIPLLGMAAPFGMEWYKGKQAERKALGPDMKKDTTPLDKPTEVQGSLPTPPVRPVEPPYMAPAWGKTPDVPAQPGPYQNNYQYPDYSSYWQDYSPTQYAGPSAPQNPQQYNWQTYTQPSWPDQYAPQQPDYNYQPPTQDYSWDQQAWDQPAPDFSSWGDYL